MTISRADKPRAARPTLTDVAREAGVSRSTTGRTLGGYGYVSAEVRDKVLAAAKKLGYRANAIAKTLSTGTAQSIGVVVADIGDLFFAEIVQGISAAVRASGYDTIVINTGDDIAVEIDAIDLLTRKQVDGIIVASSARSRTDSGHLQEAQASGVPLVLIDRLISEFESDAVVVDNRQAARDAVNLLIASGHRRIATIWGPAESYPGQDLDEIRTVAHDAAWTTRERFEGYIGALQAGGIEFDPELVATGPRHSLDAAAQVMRMFALGRPPTAILTTEKEALLGTLRALKASGRRYPDDVSVVGFDDNPWVEVMTPSITMVEQPTRTLGMEAAAILLSRIDGDSQAPQVRMLHARLIERSSVGAKERASL